VEPVVFVLLLLLAVGAWLVQRWLHQRRLAALAAVAADHGLTVTEGDPHGFAALPFTLMRAGDRRRVTTCLTGTLDGHPVHLFELRVETDHRDAKGNRSTSVRHHTCAHATLGGLALPRVRISPETVVTRLGDALGFRDQQFESDEFNRAYQVQGTDPRATSDVVDPRMMALLLEVRDRDLSFELRGDHLLCWGDRLAPTSWPTLHRIARTVADRVPRVAADLYPSTGDDDLWFPGLRPGGRHAGRGTTWGWLTGR
jgi:hypothetical protein